MASGCPCRFPHPNELINPHAPSHALHSVHTPPACTLHSQNGPCQTAICLHTLLSPSVVLLPWLGTRLLSYPVAGTVHFMTPVLVALNIPNPIASALHYCVAKVCGMQSCSAATALPSAPPTWYACMCHPLIRPDHRRRIASRSDLGTGTPHFVQTPKPLNF